MASRAKAKPPKKRQQRATSNIFAMFDQSQIQEYKEAFNIIDHDRVYFIYIYYLSYNPSFFLIRMVLLVVMILKICLLH
jgi:hypothetical protein